MCGREAEAGGLQYGLRVKSTSEVGIGDILADDKSITYPNRKSRFLRYSLQFSQLDGDGSCLTYSFETQRIKNRDTQDLIKLLAHRPGRSTAEVSTAYGMEYFDSDLDPMPDQPETPEEPYESEDPKEPDYSGSAEQTSMAIHYDIAEVPDPSNIFLGLIYAQHRNLKRAILESVAFEVLADADAQSAASRTGRLRAPRRLPPAAPAAAPF